MISDITRGEMIDERKGCVNMAEADHKESALTGLVYGHRDLRKPVDKLLDPRINTQFNLIGLDMRSRFLIASNFFTIYGGVLDLADLHIFVEFVKVWNDEGVLPDQIQASIPCEEDAVKAEIAKIWPGRFKFSVDGS